MILPDVLLAGFHGGKVFYQTLGDHELTPVPHQLEVLVAGVVVHLLSSQKRGVTEQNTCY